MDLLRALLFEFGWVIPVLIVGSIIWSVIKGRKRAKEMREAGASLNLREASKSDKKALEDHIDQSRLFPMGVAGPRRCWLEMSMACGSPWRIIILAHRVLRKKPKRLHC